jgi:DNA-binding transcriptional LysR family regulator
MLFESLIKGDLEFGIFFHTPEIPDKLEVLKAISIRHHLVVRKDLRRKKNILETFIGSREVDDTNTKRFPTLEKLRKDQPGAKIKISSNNLTAQKEMVLQGLGVAILPSFLVANELRQGSLVDIYPHEKFEFQMKFIKRRTGILSKAALELIKACIEN